MQKEYTSTTITLCYDDIILNLIWEPEMIAIRIKCRELADAYRKHFGLLWRLGKKK